MLTSWDEDAHWRYRCLLLRIFVLCTCYVSYIDLLLIHRHQVCRTGEMLISILGNP